jgi:hypothetical protein
VVCAIFAGTGGVAGLFSVQTAAGVFAVADAGTSSGTSQAGLIAARG